MFEQDRLKALKEQDTEAYYNLLKEHKNEKILNVLQQTDKYLRSLGLAVSFPQRPVLYYCSVQKIGLLGIRAARSLQIRSLKDIYNQTVLLI